MEVELCDSYFRFMLQSHLFAKKTTGIWGTCTVCSHQPVFHTVKLPQQETARLLGFFVYLHCLFYAALSGGLRLFGEHWNISALPRHITIKPLFCNGHYSVGHVEDAVNVERQFSGTDGLKRAFKAFISLLLTSAGEWLHYMFKCLFPSQMLAGDLTPSGGKTTQKAEIEQSQQRWC